MAALRKIDPFDTSLSNYAFSISSQISEENELSVKNVIRSFYEFLLIQNKITQYPSTCDGLKKVSIINNGLERMLLDKNKVAHAFCEMFYRVANLQIEMLFNHKHEKCFVCHIDLYRHWMLFSFSVFDLWNFAHLNYLFNKIFFYIENFSFLKSLLIKKSEIKEVLSSIYRKYEMNEELHNSELKIEYQPKIFRRLVYLNDEINNINTRCAKNTDFLILAKDVLIPQAQSLDAQIKKEKSPPLEFIQLIERIEKIMKKNARSVSRL